MCCEAFHYVGVLTLEFFVHRGRLIANEMAPRVHNSGHWTIEGAVTSQFENHLRAITGMPLGVTAARGHAAMINLIGKMPPAADLLAEPGLHWHHYGKEPRHGRKLGHCTIVEPNAAPSQFARLRPCCDGFIRSSPSSRSILAELMVAAGSADIDVSRAVQTAGAAVPAQRPTRSFCT